ncbi:MAG TPA: LuxR C-terminal-related transcriptional regulator, partial [Steroidobacteraceae bacterium]|nr:LuxR C-terminal-related transcriptional regulator [Steroidobacteraceae bacterium]
TPVNEVAHRGLSPRELQVLRLLVQGRSTREIARVMGINPKTVSNHQSLIRQKLGADTPIELLHVAQQLGLVPQH